MYIDNINNSSNSNQNPSNIIYSTNNSINNNSHSIIYYINEVSKSNHNIPYNNNLRTNDFCNLSNSFLQRKNNN